MRAGARRAGTAGARRRGERRPAPGVRRLSAPPRRGPPARLIVALCGLPGTGKSTLARALAPALDAALLDKDRVREALFAPGGIEHSREQDDLCCRLAYEAALWLLRSERRRAVVLDGRTYSQRGQLDPVRELARAAGAALALIECTCPAEVAHTRLRADAAEGRHPAADRTPERHRQLAASAVPLPFPRLVLDTAAGTTAEHVQRCLAWLARPADGPR